MTKIVIPTVRTEEEVADLVAEIKAISSSEDFEVSVVSDRDSKKTTKMNEVLDGLKDEELIIFIDDDVSKLSEGMFKEMVDAFEDENVLSSEPKITTLKGRPSYKCRRAETAGVRYLPIPSKQFSGTCFAIRKTKLRFDEEQESIEEIDYACELAELFPKGIFVVCTGASLVHKGERKHKKYQIAAEQKLFSKRARNLQLRSALKRRLRAQSQE